MKATIFTRQNLFDQCCGPAADGRFCSSDVSLAEGQRGVVSFRCARQYHGYSSGIASLVVALLGALPRRHLTQRLTATVCVRRGLPSIPAVATGKHAPDHEPDMLMWYVPRTTGMSSEHSLSCSAHKYPWRASYPSYTTAVGEIAIITYSCASRKFYYFQCYFYIFSFDIIGSSP
jgi:hypothetical protein